MKKKILTLKNIIAKKMLHRHVFCRLGLKLDTGIDFSACRPEVAGS